jgi:hypothetical protein
MQATRKVEPHRDERPLLLAGLTCCLALVLGLAAVAAAGSAAWLRGGLSVAGLLLLGTGGGLLAAHLILDERRAKRDTEGVMIMADRARTWLAGVGVAALVAAGWLAVVSWPQTQPGAAVSEAHPDRDQHNRMLQRMRVDASPRMVETMRSDPVGQMMRDPRHIRLMEQEQAGLDRMLGRNPAGPRR